MIDQLDGTFRKADDLSNENGKTVFNYAFGAADALMLFVSDKFTTDFLPEMNRFAPDAQAIRILPEKSWQIAKVSENTLTLDRCRYRYTVYRNNRYSPLYIFECVAMEFAKLIIS